MPQKQIDEQFDTEHREGERSLLDYVHIILKRRNIVVAVAVIVTVLATLKTYSETPLFTSSSQVLIERNRSAKGLDTQYYYYEPNFLETQSAIITSPNVAKRVVRNLQLDTKYRHFFIRDKKEGPSIVSALADNVSGPFKKDAEQAAPEDSVAQASAKMPSELADTANPDIELIAGMIRSRLSVSREGKTKILNITYSDPKPEMARMIADGVVKAYMEEILEIKLSTSSYALRWMTSKAEEERRKLEDAEMKLQQYMRENDLITVEDRLTIYPQKVADFSSQLSKVESERKELEALYKQIQEVNGDPAKLENLPAFAESTVLQDLREQIYQAEQELKKLSQKYGYKHPVIIKAKSELADLRELKLAEMKRIVDSAENTYKLTLSREENLRELLKKAKEDLLDLNEKFVQYSIMKREVDTVRVLYEALTSGINKENITEESQTYNIWVVKPANLPGGQSFPNNKKAILVGLIMGLAGGIGVAFFIDYLDNTIKNEKDLMGRFGGVVLGSVAELKEPNQSIETQLVREPLSPLAESYRLIRSNLMLSTAGQPPRTLLVTSMGPQEGKTSTTLNLARAFVQMGKTVVIVDCDMRRPRMHTVFGVKRDKGLASYLTGNCSDEFSQTIPREQLVFIPAGPNPPNPAELLDSDRMKQLVAQLRDEYDFVLLDSPPIQAVTDSLALSQFVDGTLLVVRSGKTTFDMLASGVRKLHMVNAHILGYVINGLRKSDASGGYYSGYGYTEYYAKDDD